MKTYQVPNRLIVVGMLLGLLTNFCEYGVFGLRVWVIGTTVPFLLLFWLFMFRMIGAGDVKLLTVVGGFLGYYLVIQSILYAFLLGAIISIYKIIQNKNLMNRLKYLADYLIKTINTKKLQPYYNLERDGTDNVIPFTLTITGGVILVLLKK